MHSIGLINLCPRGLYACTPACCCSDDFFAAVKAAFSHPEHCIDPLLRKDYIRLVKAVNLRAEVFSKRQQAQLEVYTIMVSQLGGRTHTGEGGCMRRSERKQGWR